MLSRLLAFACVVAMTFAVASGEEIRGKVKTVDPAKNTITITVEDKDTTYDVNKDTKYVALFGKKLKKAQQQELPGGLSAIKEGAIITLTTEKKDNKDVVSQVKLEDLQPKKKKKNNN